MPIQLTDQVLLDQASMRETRDGYLVANAKSARTGIQTYRARELGLTDRNPDDIVRVYRPPEEVFAGDAMTSMAHRPITMDHPPEMVTADNWKRYARGATGEEVVRDGDFVRVPLVLMDKAAIEDVRSGKRELSWGYTCEVELVDGTTPDGERYDAIQRGIRANHLAVCSVARGGPQLRIGDNARRETVEPSDGGRLVPTKTITFDGLPVEVTDAAEAVINKLKGLLDTANTAKTAAETQVGTLTATVQAKDGEIAALKQQLKDAEVTPAKLQQLADARAKVIADAKKIAGEALVVDGKTDLEIKRAAVAAKLGDAAANMADAGIEGAFVTLAATATDSRGPDPLRQAISSQPVNVGDARAQAEQARQSYLQSLRDGWKNPTSHADAA